MDYLSKARAIATLVEQASPPEEGFKTQVHCAKSSKSSKSPGDPLDCNRWTSDPRPDLAHDSARWVRLLTLAYEWDGDDPDGLFGVVHGLRCLGAGLRRARSGELVIDRGDMPAQQYDEVREALVPHAPTLIALLTALKDEDEQGDQSVSTGPQRERAR